MFTPNARFATNVATMITIGRINFFLHCLTSRSIATFNSNAVAPHYIPFNTSCTYSFSAIRS